ncbi:MAG: hypothetical protein M3296_10560 [Actinomycetota bacterium]|nr:hypothetical protein [Actinomycetota bacterium]
MLAGFGDDSERSAEEREPPRAAQTAGVPPPGEGVDRDEAAPIGATIDLAGIAYTPQITQQLNSHIAPDRELVGGRRAGKDRLWLGAFIRACNEDDRVREPPRRLALVGAFGEG